MVEQLIKEIGSEVVSQLTSPGVKEMTSSAGAGLSTVLDAEVEAGESKHLKGDTLFHKILYKGLGPSDKVESQQLQKSEDFKLQATRAQRSASTYERSLSTPILLDQLDHLRGAVRESGDATAELKKICGRLENVRDIKDSMLTGQGQGMMVKILLVSGVSSNIALPAVYGGTYVALFAADKELSREKKKQERVVEGTISSVDSNSAAVYRVLIEHLAETSEKELKKLRSDKRTPPGEIATKEKELEYLTAAKAASHRRRGSEELSDLFNESMMVKLYATEKNPRILEQRQKAIQDKIKSLEEQQGVQANIYQKPKKLFGLIPRGSKIEVTSSEVATDPHQKFTGSITDPRREAGLNAKIDVLRKESQVLDNLLGNLKRDAKLKTSSSVTSTTTSQSSTSSLGSQESLYPQERQKIYRNPTKTLSDSSQQSVSSVSSDSDRKVSSPTTSTTPPPLERQLATSNLARPRESWSDKLAYQAEKIKHSKSLSDHDKRISKAHVSITVADDQIRICQQTAGICESTAQGRRVNPREWQKLREEHSHLGYYAERMAEKLDKFPAHVKEAREKLSQAEFSKTQDKYRAVLKEYTLIQSEYRKVIAEYNEIGKVLEKAPGRSAKEGWGDGSKDGTGLTTFSSAPPTTRSSSALIFEKVGMPGTKEAKETVKREESPTQSVTHTTTSSHEVLKVKTTSKADTSQVKKDQSDDRENTPSIMNS